MIWFIACEATGGSSSDGHHMGLVKQWEYRENIYYLKGENSSRNSFTWRNTSLIEKFGSIWKMLKKKKRERKKGRYFTRKTAKFHWGLFEETDNLSQKLTEAWWSPSSLWKSMFIWRNHQIKEVQFLSRTWIFVVLTSVVAFQFTRPKAKNRRNWTSLVVESLYSFQTTQELICAVSINLLLRVAPRKKFCLFLRRSTSKLWCLYKLLHIMSPICISQDAPVSSSALQRSV